MISYAAMETFKNIQSDPLSKKKKLNDRVNTCFASDFMGVYYIYKSFLLTV